MVGLNYVILWFFILWWNIGEFLVGGNCSLLCFERYIIGYLCKVCGLVLVNYFSWLVMIEI